eukprot:462135-Pyramimonas_sp.AAC.1
MRPGKGGVCSRTTPHHVQLSGAAPGARKWTSFAAEHPPRFAAAAAVLSHSAEQMRALGGSGLRPGYPFGKW